MIENKILKMNARAQLGNGIFKEKWMTVLLVCAIPSLAMSLISEILGGANFFGVFLQVNMGNIDGILKGIMLSAVLMFVASTIVYGPFRYGVVKVTLAQVENDKWSIVNVFDGFKECFLKSFLLGLLETLFLALWSMLLVPGIIKSYSYALAFYIQRDNKDKEAIDCITESRMLMKGHKWQLFCLDMSFIGWYIVGAFCFGIGTYFVVPYHEMARANFYEALIAEVETNSGKEEEAKE